MKQFAVRFSLLSLLLLVTAVEHAVGLPVIASTIFLFLLSQLSRPVQLVVNLGWAIIVATLFIGPYWLCLLLTSLAMEIINKKTESVIQKQMRLLFTSLLLIVGWTILLKSQNSIQQIWYSLVVGSSWLLILVLVWGIRKRPHLSVVGRRIQHTQNW